MKQSILLSILALFVSSCTGGGSPRPARSFEQIKESGVLRVVTKNGPTTYYEDREGKMVGLEHDMITSFAQSLGLKPEFIVEASIEDSLDRLRTGKADLAAAGLSVTDNRQEEFIFTSDYQKVHQQVVCRPGVNPKNLEALSKHKLVLESESSYAERALALETKDFALNWESTSDMATGEILEKLSDENPTMDCTVADSQVVAFYVRLFPKLNIAMNLGEEDKLAWALRPENEELAQKASVWIESAGKQGLLASWQDQYYAHTKDFDPYDLKKFMERLKTRLPKYKKLFIQAEKETGIEWRLLAAVAYQESNWDPQAKSPTGVRGLMMLTQNTAQSVGVKDRLNPEESIMGGARYLKKLMNQTSSHIDKEDRFWVALASYNVGAAHVRDARGLAAWRGHNPNQWSGIKRALPLLEKKSVHWRLPHGFARGIEPVVYVRRVRHYYDLMKR